MSHIQQTSLITNIDDLQLQVESVGLGVFGIT